MSIFYLQYESKPKQQSVNYVGFGGAFVSCWIQAKSVENTATISRKAIQDNMYEIISLEESYSISEADYDDGDENLIFYREAELYGECYFYDTWPNEHGRSD